MIIDLKRFVDAERPFWNELEALLAKFEADPGFRLDLNGVKRFHYLYERASAGLGKLMTFAAEPEVRAYLESLVSRAYAETHETRARPNRFAFREWLFRTFPQTFRRRIRAFQMSCLMTIAGMAFGMFALMVDPGSKELLVPFSHVHGDPRERVAREERITSNPVEGHHAQFSASLMTHNTRVSIFAMGLGITYGLGTVIILFYNGIILGLIALDYVLAGETVFLLGWLLPHGAVEIPAILIGGQAGFALAAALIGRGNRLPLSFRLKAVSKDLFTLIAGAGLLLIWAGIVEAFLSQYHEPVLPYAVKIAFGVIELGLLFLFLARAGQKEAAA